MYGETLGCRQLKACSAKRLMRRKRRPSFSTGSLAYIIRSPENAAEITPKQMKTAVITVFELQYLDFPETREETPGNGKEDV